MKELKNLTPSNETLSTLYFSSVNGDILFPKQNKQSHGFLRGWSHEQCLTTENTDKPLAAFQ